MCRSSLADQLLAADDQTGTGGVRGGPVISGFHCLPNELDRLA
jgi:hypothetical protein